MNSELNVLNKNNTWTFTQLSKGKKAIGCGWIYKTKFNANGSINKCKARLVAKGYNQIDGVDFYQSFDPVAKNVTVRLLLTLTAASKWHLHQIDVNNVFLHGCLDEDVYMSIPEGLKCEFPNQVCKLNKSLYGLKQSSRQWHLEISKSLSDIGFLQSHNDHCLFIKKIGEQITCLLLYVDDILLAGNSL